MAADEKKTLLQISLQAKLSDCLRAWSDAFLFLSQRGFVFSDLRHPCLDRDQPAAFSGMKLAGWPETDQNDC